MVHSVTAGLVTQAGRGALGDGRAGQLGAVGQNSGPAALPAARGRHSGMLGALCMFSATMHAPHLLL